MVRPLLRARYHHAINAQRYADACCRTSILPQKMSPAHIALRRYSVARFFECTLMRVSMPSVTTRRRCDVDASAVDMFREALRRRPPSIRRRVSPTVQWW